MDDLLADFIAETREMLEASGGEIVAWEADPADRARLRLRGIVRIPAAEYLSVPIPPAPDRIAQDN